MARTCGLVLTMGIGLAGWHAAAFAQEPSTPPAGVQAAEPADASDAVDAVDAAEAPQPPELLDADALLDRVRQRQVDVAEAADADGELTLRERIEAMAQAHTDADGDDTPAPDAAAKWLGLADAWVAQASIQAFGYDPSREAPVQFSELVTAIPGPAAWPTLVERIAARPAQPGAAGLREGALKLLAHFLERDAEAVAVEMQAISKIEGLDPWVAQSLPEQLRYVAAVLSNAGQSGDQQIELLEQQIAAARAGGSVHHLQIPDLVTIVGPEKAQALLRRIVVLPVDNISIQVGDETKAMARRLALELVDELARARWELVDTIDAVALYEAMANRFLPRRQAAADVGADSDKPDQDQVAQGKAPAAPSAGGATIDILSLRSLLGGDSSPVVDPATLTANSWEYRQARTYYILGLVADGRTQDAAAELRAAMRQAGPSARHSFNLPYGALDQLDQAGFTDRIFSFLDALLRDDPDLPLWEMYMSAAVRSGNSPAMLELAESAAARPGLTEMQRAAILGQLASAQLAADEVERGIETLRQLLAIDPAANPQRLEHAIQLARVGTLLDRPQWMEEGVDAAMQILAAPASTDGDHWRRSYAVSNLANLLIQVGRHAQAQHLLAGALAEQIETQRREAAQRMQYGGGFDSWQSEATAETLALLAGLYHDLGRHDDELTLLEDGPYWGEADLAGLLDLEAGEGRTLGTVAAAALADAGRDGQAYDVVRAALLHNGGNDRAYELLIELRGADAIALLDRLFERDRFEERPLIWKAHLQWKAQDYDQALATIRQAIAIDPSDGEQGRGDRMRAYGVLADILESRGQAGDASLYRGAVAAIRIAEDADRLYAAGLLLRGVRQYQDALSHFADAYCIQSRLAVQLSQLGRHEEAAEHFRKAYELMPDSFGRVESHCFGCEGVFSVGEGQGIAENVFGRLIVETPDKPQVHYLYGYLLSAKGEHDEAVQHLRKAVELDRDYLSAWRQLASTAQRIHLPAALRDRATLNVLRLDPLRRHSHADLSTVVDVADMWRAVEQSRAAVEPAPRQVLPLPASAAEVARTREQLETLREQAGIPPHAYQTMDDDGEGPPDAPAQVLARHQFVQGLNMLTQQ